MYLEYLGVHILLSNWSA